MDAARQGRLVAGRYCLTGIIGRGGMGVVWQARDELLDRDVAVKEILWPPYLTEQEQQAACRRASREAQMAARLNHRNVIRVFDIVEEDDCPWIVMELLPYRSLRDLVEGQGRVTPAQAAQVGLGILAALRAAHAEGIVHQDVKPANILIGPDGRVVLTDFGIACAAADSPTLTTASLLVGSPSYIAPERAQGRQSGPPADLWGLGASLYTAVEGHPPFDRDGALASLTAVVTDEPDPAEHAGPLWPVISGLLRKDPDERLGAARTERMLRGVVAAPAGPGPGPMGSAVASTPVPSRSRRSRGRLAAVAGSAALVVLAASGTAMGLSLSGSPQHQVTSAEAATRPPPASAPASTQPPVAAAGTPAVSSHPKKPASPHLTARTSRPHKPRPSLRAAHHSRHGHTSDGGNRDSVISQVEGYLKQLRGSHHPGRWARSDHGSVTN